VSAPARQAASGDALAGVVPRSVVEPETVPQAVEVMSSLARDRAAVAFAGGGTELDLGRPPERLDALVRTGRLARVVEHAPADQVVAVEAGITLAALQEHLAPHGQRLALDPPLPDRATVGGLLAANGFGPRRTRFGGIRDLVIGITVVRADGALVRGGGKVVKNVAGYDLPRLFCGSLGTLGLVAEVVLRLHPLPEASATLAVDGLAAVEVRQLAVKALAAGLEPVAVAATGDGGRFRLLVRFEGFAPGVADQADRLVGLAGRPVRRLAGAGEAAEWARHDTLRAGGDFRAKATFAPARLEQVAAVLGHLGRVLEGAAEVHYPTLGIAFLSGDLRDPPAAGRAIEEARAAVQPDGGAVVLGAAPAALRALVDPWGQAPPALAVMRRLKAELDPENRLAPGRFVGGI
jgi:glycolate oxidase FAD binding subunit